MNLDSAAISILAVQREGTIAGDMEEEQVM